MRELDPAQKDFGRSPHAQVKGLASVIVEPVRDRAEEQAVESRCQIFAFVLLRKLASLLPAADSG